MAHRKCRGINEAFYLWWPPPVVRVVCRLTGARPRSWELHPGFQKEELSWLGSHPDIGNCGSPGSTGLTGVHLLGMRAECFTQDKQPILHAPAVSRSRLFWPKADQERQRATTSGCSEQRAQRSSSPSPGSRWAAPLACHVLSELHGRPTSKNFSTSRIRATVNSQQHWPDSQQQQQEGGKRGRRTGRGATASDSS